MHNTPALLQTEPLGNPAADVGIFLIERLLANKVQALSAVMQEPTIIASEKESVLLFTPPNIADRIDDATLQQPPPIVEKFAEDVFLYPPLIEEQEQLIALQPPPETTELLPVTVFLHPPPIVDWLLNPINELQIPPAITP